jgi:hypothetical protein
LPPPTVKIEKEDAFEGVVPEFPEIEIRVGG